MILLAKKSMKEMPFNLKEMPFTRLVCIHMLT